VQDGVKPGEKVVIDGLDKLRDGAQVALIAAPGTPTPTPHRARIGANRRDERAHRMTS